MSLPRASFETIALDGVAVGRETFDESRPDESVDERCPQVAGQHSVIRICLVRQGEELDVSPEQGRVAIDLGIIALKVRVVDPHAHSHSRVSPSDC
jgi:hypothetical protein